MAAPHWCRVNAGRGLTVHSNPWFQVTHTPDSNTTDGRGWYRVVRPDSITVVPVLPDGRLVLLYGVRDTTGPAPTYELPAGGIAAGESPEAAALREVQEESGYFASRLDPLGSFVECPGLSASQCWVFLATRLTRRAQALEAGEHWVPAPIRERALSDLIASGLIVDGGTLAALQFYRLWQKSRGT